MSPHIHSSRRADATGMAPSPSSAGVVNQPQTQETCSFQNKSFKYPTSGKLA